MTFTLTIDEPGWDESVRLAAKKYPDVVPVIKGNGYGFGRGRLGALATRLQMDTVAVGTEAEVASVRMEFRGSIVVLAPLTLADLRRPAPEADYLIHTVSHADVVRRLAQPDSPRPAIILELDSPVHRHGVALTELPGLAAPLRQVRLTGFAMHLPSGGDRRKVLESVHEALFALRKAGIKVDTFWVSHLTVKEQAEIQAAEPGLRIRPRVGTELWLADRKTFTVTGTVLDVRRAPHKQAVGYRQRRVSGGSLVVVSGGTAHGVGLYTSSARSGWQEVLKSVALGAVRGAGWSPSPFHWAGHRLHFADVAHMQVSMLVVPAGVAPPQVGDALNCDVRMTVSTFDEVVVSCVTPGKEKGFPVAS
jgi:alanine racemase